MSNPINPRVASLRFAVMALAAVMSGASFGTAVAALLMPFIG